MIQWVGSRDELIRNITRPEIRHLIVDGYHFFRGDTLPVIQEYYTLERQFGNVYILRRVR